MKQDVRRFVKILHDETRSNQYCSVFLAHPSSETKKKLNPQTTKILSISIKKPPFKVGFADAGL